jgi:4-amino-4-deoxy-L-arabinose transferase-like glycosyltransferase
MGIHVWRQAQTQTTINNFYEEDMNILNPRRNDRGNSDGIFRMEFPLMQWLVAGTYKIFGNHLIISRIFMFIIGLGSVLGMYCMLQALFKNNTLALMGAWAFNFSPSFYYYTINPLPDNFALCCSIWGIAVFFHWTGNNKNHLLLLSGLLLSIGALCKLPFILYFLVPLAFFILVSAKNKFNKNLIINILSIVIFTIPPIVWYILVIPYWRGNGIVSGIMDNQVPSIVVLDYLQHNLVSTLPELFLNYGSVLFFISGFYFLFKRKAFRNPLFPVLVVWSLGILCYFLFEINMIAKIHDYYLFPFYPLLFMLVSYGAYNFLRIENKIFKFLTLLIMLILPFTAHLRMQTRWNPDSPGFNKDLLIYKQELRNAVPQNALCVAGSDVSHFVFFYYIDKKGWGFDSGKLDGSDLKKMIDEGAEFLYSDSRTVDTSQQIRQFLNQLVIEKGSVRVYRLQKSAL